MVHGAIPLGLSLAIAFVAWSFRVGSDRAPYGVAAVITGFLLITLRNEWDLVTWLAPRADPRDWE